MRDRQVDTESETQETKAPYKHSGRQTDIVTDSTGQKEASKDEKKGEGH